MATKNKKPKKIEKAGKKETPIQQVVSHYFSTKGLTLEQLKKDAKKKNIIYARFAKAAKDLLELAGNASKAKRALTKVAKWANTRNLDYTIETVSKKWLELDKLKPKKIERKPFYEGRPMRQKDGKWYVVPDDGGEWLEFADAESKIEWKTI